MTARSDERGADAGRVITVRDLVRIVLRGAPLALLLAVAAGGAAYYVSHSSTPIFSARVGVVASQPGSQFGDLSLIAPPSVDPGVYQSAIIDGDVISEALTRLNGTPPSETELLAFLRTLRVRVESTLRSSLVWIEVRNASPAYAADAANLIAEELVAWDRERARRSIERSIAALRSTLGDLEDQRSAAAAAGETARVEQLDVLIDRRERELATALDLSANALVVGLLEPLREVTAPERPVAPRVLFTTLVATLLGIVVGYAVQLLRWVLDTRIGGRVEVAAATGLPVLAEFPRVSRRTTELAAESASVFRTNLILATRKARPRVVVVTSPLTRSEKDGVAISLAESFARTGNRTLLVDADLRHPGLTERFDVIPEGAVPLEVLLANPERRYQPVTVTMAARRSFDFVPSFSSERFPADLVNEGLAPQLEAWGQAYDTIVLDASPVMPFADVLALAPLSTGVVLCANVARTTREHLTEALELLSGGGARVLGVVLTGVRLQRRLKLSDLELVDRRAVDPYVTQVTAPRGLDGERRRGTPARLARPERPGPGT